MTSGGQARYESPDHALSRRVRSRHGITAEQAAEAAEFAVNRASSEYAAKLSEDLASFRSVIDSGSAPADMLAAGREIANLAPTFGYTDAARLASCLCRYLDHVPEDGKRDAIIARHSDILAYFFSGNALTPDESEAFDRVMQELEEAVETRIARAAS